MCRYSFFVAFLFLGFSCKQTVEIPDVDSSLYISRVFEYVYAPGQHASLALMSDTAGFRGNPDGNNNSFVYLGGFGGYLIAGFDHNVPNDAGVDFEIFLMKGAAPEPAVVYVMADSNADGIPNDTWYELKGNKFNDSKRNYWVRYYKPTTQTENIKWLDSEGARGELKAGFSGSNTSAWWWPATKTDSITLRGTRLPDSYENSGNDASQLWTVPTAKFTWGYAENNSGTDYDSDKGSNKLDISNAVDENGNPVSLAGIRFIKIQTAVFQQAGWLNEVSSEIRGAKEIK